MLKSQCTHVKSLENFWINLKEPRKGAARKEELDYGIRQQAGECDQFDGGRDQIPHLSAEVPGRTEKILLG